ncbi:MAG: flagellar assembly peptidoglycan hydrolase FlgJ [Methylophaga sp.]|nr:flagellar assembly peptidoglycan hydrolase FlgJ [Methylophaga sp.]
MALESKIAQSAIDFHGLNQLRQQAGQGRDEEQTLRQVAGQFESLFVNMMLKSMRQASLAEGLFDSEQSKMYQDMADQQLASDLSMRGGLGLQDVIMRQLGGARYANSAEAVPGQTFSIDTVTVRPSLGIRVNEKIIEQIREAKPQPLAEDTEVVETDMANMPKRFNSPEEFVEKLWPYAERAAEKLGVAPEVILSQAALETGWGKHILADQQGSSFNLFNIKAHRWDGDTVAKNALEYRDGIALHEQSQFRVYDSYQHSFDDYVRFLQTQPRYSQALQHVGDPNAFIEQLHKAGYATDPQYADKIKRIMNSDTLAQMSLDMDLF